MTWFWGEKEIAESNLRQAFPCAMIKSMRNAINLLLEAAFWVSKSSVLIGHSIEHLKHRGPPHNWASGSINSTSYWYWTNILLKAKVFLNFPPIFLKEILKSTEGSWWYHMVPILICFFHPCAVLHHRCGLNIFILPGPGVPVIPWPSLASGTQGNL